MRVQDLGSLNGTYVNGQRVHATNSAQEVGAVSEGGPPIGTVQSGDLITIGGTSFLVEFVDCPSIQGPDHDLIWTEGEVAKKDCPIPCVDGSVAGMRAEIRC